MATEIEYTRYIKKILTDSRISKANLEILKNYDSNGTFQQVTVGTKEQRLIILRQLALFVNKDFKDMDKEDIEKFFSSLGEIASKTWSTKGAFIKSFFKWLYKSDEYPSNVKWIKTTVKNKNHKLPSDLLTKNDIKSMANKTGNLSDKTFILVLYESACRIGEILNLKIKDVSFDQYGSIIMVDGKTGMRRIRLIESSPDLIKWINNHPDKENRDTPLFIYLSDKNRYKLFSKGISYNSATIIIKNVAKRAGIKKRVHPHLFRHSRLTELAKILSESELKKFAGWTGGSTMAGIYVHLSGADIDKKMLEKYGLLDKNDDPDKDTLKPKECPKCKEVNPNTAKFCYVCCMLLDMKVTAKIEPQNDRDIEKKILKNKGVKIESKEPQTDDVLSKGLIQFIFKNHPEIVHEFLKNNGMDDLYSKVVNRIPEKNKATALLM
jgi:integrase/recombinase XerD